MFIVIGYELVRSTYGCGQAPALLYYVQTTQQMFAVILYRPRVS